MNCEVTETLDKACSELITLTNGSGIYHVNADSGEGI